MRQLELQKGETDSGTSVMAPNSAGAWLSPNSTAAFDVSKNISLVPVFRERLRPTSAHLSALPLLYISQKMCGQYFCCVS